MVAFRDQKIKMEEIATIVGMSKEGIYRICLVELGMFKFSVRWVLRVLNVNKNVKKRHEFPTPIDCGCVVRDIYFDLDCNGYNILESVYDTFIDYLTKDRTTNGTY